MLVRADYEGENRLLRWAGSWIEQAATQLTALRLQRKRFSQWAYSLTHHPKFFRLLDVYVLRGFWFFFGLVLVVFVSLFVVITLFELLPDIVKNNVDYGVVAALRVLDALDATSPSVGAPMDICRISPDGARHLSPDEVEGVRNQVSRWVELENRALDELFD